MKRHRKLTIVLLAVGLAGALLTTASVAFGGVPGQRLDLVLNDTNGDMFTLGPVGGPATDTQRLSTSGCQISPSEGALVRLTATANASNPAPGLKDHIIGVRAQGEGNGTPCARINGGQAARGEVLTIEFFGPVIGAWHADYAQFGIKIKFGATGQIQAFNDGLPVGAPAPIECGDSDCGPDSGNDRRLITLPVGEENYVFDAVEISVVSPDDGSVSLLDDPAAGFDTYFTLAADTDGPNLVLIGDDPLILTVGDPFVDPGANVIDNYDLPRAISGVSTVPVDESGNTTATGEFTVTYNAEDSSGNAATELTRTVLVFDGTLGCGDTATTGDGLGAPQVDITRTDIGTDCDKSKFYSLGSAWDEDVEQSFDFEPVGDFYAEYTMTVTWVAEPSTTPVPATEMDFDNDGNIDGDLQWCRGTPTAPVLPTSGDPWCRTQQEVTITSNGLMQVIEYLFGTGDPSGFRAG